MIIQYNRLSQYPKVFQAMTGLRIVEFEQGFSDLLPLYEPAEVNRLSRAERRRAMGGGGDFELSVRDRVLLTVIWLRKYPTHEVVGYLFGVSDSTVGRYLGQILPLLETSGRDTMRLPDPGRKRRRQLDELLQATPQLAVIIDTFEHRIQRPRQRTQADPYYSGKKKQHPLKSQVAVDEFSGEIVDIAESSYGPTADLTLLKQSELLSRLPPEIGGLGDLAYVGLDQLHPQGLGATPRRKPRGKPRPAEVLAYNTAFARRRIIVENSILPLRRYEALNQTDRNHRQQHTARVRAVAGLVNRQIRHRLPC
jgi:hypothetical protein